MKRNAFVTYTAVLVVTVVILFADLAAAQVSVKRCRTINECPEGQACVTTRGAPRGVCSTGELGALCGGRFGAECVEGECTGGRCTETATTASSST